MPVRGSRARKPNDDVTPPVAPPPTETKISNPLIEAISALAQDPNCYDSGVRVVSSRPINVDTRVVRGSVVPGTDISMVAGTATEAALVGISRINERFERLVLLTAVSKKDGTTEVLSVPVSFREGKPGAADYCQVGSSRLVSRGETLSPWERYVGSPGEQEDYDVCLSCLTGTRDNPPTFEVAAAHWSKLRKIGLVTKGGSGGFFYKSIAGTPGVLALIAQRMAERAQGEENILAEAENRAPVEVVYRRPWIDRTAETVTAPTDTENVVDPFGDTPAPAPAG